FFFSSRRRHTRFSRDWSSDVCSSDLLNKSKKIGSMKEYERFYGFGAPITVNSVDIGIDNNVLSADITQQYMLYEALRMFFENGRSEERRVGKEWRTRRSHEP